MHKGRVIWFNSTKGYGFIDAGMDKNVFVHHSAIQMEGFQTLTPHEEVIVDVGSNDRGLFARTVTPLGF